MNEGSPLREPDSRASMNCVPRLLTPFDQPHVHRAARSPSRQLPCQTLGSLGQPACLPAPVRDSRSKSERGGHGGCRNQTRSHHRGRRTTGPGAQGRDLPVGTTKLKVHERWGQHPHAIGPLAGASRGTPIPCLALSKHQLEANQSTERGMHRATPTGMS